MQNYTKKFNELDKTKADIAGGKGASLGEMLNAGIPVPDGFVVLSTTFENFLHKADLIQEIDAILESVDHKAVHSIDGASEKIQELIKHAEMPSDIATEIENEFAQLDSEFVAVRSSATAEDGADHAWAGQLDSYLNTTKETLLEKVQHCWASLFTPRAIFYRFEKGLNTTKISVAVVVQKMVNSEKSGIAFSVHPVTEDRNQIIIEAGFGLGEAIVSGSVTPDSYVVEKEPRKIIDINVSNQTRAMYRKAGGGNEWQELGEKGGTQVFSELEILDLANIIMTIENHYGFPCDIEWAFENGKFYIVQSRPITTLSKVGEQKISFEKAYTRDTTMIIQQGWNACVTNPFYASGINPFTPPVIHYMNDGVIEIWENEKATQWIMDSVQELIKNDESKLIAFVDQYEKDLIEIKEYWAKGAITNAEEFEKYVNRVFAIMKGFDCMYFPSVDERTPKHIRERMLKLRDSDTYFDSNDKLMRVSLIAIYPELKGYESAILKSEIKNPPSLEILKARKKSFVVIGEEFAEQTTIREYLTKNPEYHFHIEIPPRDSSTLIGQVGNKGYAKGIVRIMKRKEQISEAQDGDIIVSTMTTPDFVPAMQKASAIITDEGGITCHAAIVARELNKPCVIGTKFATQILHDGDEVEVDADNGIVKILKNESSNINKIEQFLKEKGARDYINQQGNMSIALLGNACNAIQDKYISKYGYSDVEPILVLQKNNQCICYFDLEMYRNFSRTSYKNINSSVYDLTEYSEYKKIIGQIGEDYNNFEISNSTEKLKLEILKYFEWVKQLISSTLFAEAVDHEIAKELAQKEKVKDIESFIQIVTLATKPSFVTHYNQLLLDNKDIGWSFTNYFGAPTKEERLKLSEKKHQEISRQNVESEIKKTSQMIFKNQKDIELLIEKSSMGENKLIEFIQASINIRDERKEFVLKLFTLLSDNLRALADKYGISYEAISTVADNEIDLLESTEFLQELRRRSETGVALVSRATGSEIFTVDYDRAREIIFSSVQASNVIEGVCANKGYCKGVARVILSEDAFDQLKEGEILITGMTRAEYVPLMKKAGAIVTDEGGVTCHAAIVSRELSKPCVIATRNATLIIKSGDMVEVDADSGIVKIISS